MKAGDCWRRSPYATDAERAVGVGVNGDVGSGYGSSAVAPRLELALRWHGPVLEPALGPVLHVLGLAALELVVLGGGRAAGWDVWALVDAVGRVVGIQSPKRLPRRGQLHRHHPHLQRRLGQNWLLYHWLSVVQSR